MDISKLTHTLFVTKRRSQFGLETELGANINRNIQDWTLSCYLVLLLIQIMVSN